MKDGSKEASFMAQAYRGEREEERENASEREKKINKCAKASF